MNQTAEAGALRVGWIGTGRMGAAMAGRLARAGNDVTVETAIALERAGSDVLELERAGVDAVIVSGSDVESLVGDALPDV